MKPGERIKLIKKLATALGNLDWNELDLTLRQFDLPWSDNWSSQDRVGYAIAHIENADDEKLLELDEYLYPASGPTSAAAERQTGDPGVGLWTKGLFRLFLSHTHHHKSEVAALKVALRRRSIDGFVAHEDIEPTKKWEAEIERALHSCDGLAAYLTKEFPKSKFTDHEVGWCLGRDLPILPIRIEINPYGFMGKWQAIAGAAQSADDLAEEMLGLLIKHPTASPRMASALVNRFTDSPSFNAARENLRLIQRIPKKAWSKELITAVETALKSNDQLTAWFGSSSVDAEAKKLLKKVSAP